MATSTTLIVWSAWRLVEAKWLLKCFPFHTINIALIVGASSLAVLGKELIQDASMIFRIGITGLSIVILLSFAFWGAREPEDDDILRTIKAKFSRLLGRTSQK